MARKYYLQKTLILAAAVVYLSLPLEKAAACKIRNGETTPTITTRTFFTEQFREYSYRTDLLQEILRVTEDEYGPCEITPIKSFRPINRVYLFINDGRQFDILDSTVTPLRDQQLLPIRFPIYRGLMGYRIMIIREDEQRRFDHIQSINDLRQITIGASKNWYDRKVIKQHNIPVADADDINAVYRMLPARRFDAILRGAHEIIVDEHRIKPSHYAVEQNLGVLYPLPVNFYVQKHNFALADRIKKGLKKMHEDGTFQAYFYKHRLMKETLERLQLENRTRIYLCNPDVPADIPLSKPEYWHLPWPDHIANCSKPNPQRS